MPDAERRRGGSHRKVVLVALVALLLTTAGIALAVTGTVPVSDGVTLQSPDGMTTTLDGSTDAQLEEPFPTAGTVEWTTEAGNVSFFSSGSANATVHADDITGTYTVVTAITADPNTITIDPEDKDQAIVGQEIDEFSWRSNIAADDGTVDFTYDASGPGEVALQGLASNERVAAIDAGDGQLLDETTTSGAGVATFDSLESGSHDVNIQTFDPHEPVLSNPSPTGEVGESPDQVSIDVSDGDFPRGDAVQVTLDVDGSQVHQETITSNQTVTASVPGDGRTGGEHDWSVEADDSYGESTTDSYSYTVPRTLNIYDEETVELIDDQTVNLTIYPRDSDEAILTTSTDNGTVDLQEGFPTDEPFVVVAESDGYLDRRVYVDSIFETQDIYLLNESLEHTDVIFSIEDYSGSFPPEDTVLEVQRGINGSWETVLGDYFGANDQFESQLRFNERHRLVLRNAETGQSRVLGSYTPLASGTETLTISPRGEIEMPDTHPVVSHSPSTRTLPAQSDVNVSTEVSNGTVPLDSWDVSVYHIDDGTNTTLASDSSTDPTGGTVNSSLDLSGLQGQIKIVTYYTFNGDASGSDVAIYNIMGEPSESMTLFDGILATVGLVPDSDSESVLSLTAMILTVVGTTAVGSAFRMSSEEMGLVALALVAAFAILGWVEYNLFFTVLVLFASIVFIRRRW